MSIVRPQHRGGGREPGGSTVPRPRSTLEWLAACRRPDAPLAGCWSGHGDGHGGRSGHQRLSPSAAPRSPPPTRVRWPKPSTRSSGRAPALVAYRPHQRRLPTLLAWRRLTAKGTSPPGASFGGRLPVSVPSASRSVVAVRQRSGHRQLGRPGSRLLLPVYRLPVIPSCDGCPACAAPSSALPRGVSPSHVAVLLRCCGERQGTGPYSPVSVRIAVGVAPAPTGIVSSGHPGSIRHLTPRSTHSLSALRGFGVPQRGSFVKSVTVIAPAAARDRRAADHQKYTFTVSAATPGGGVHRHRRLW